MHTWLHKTWIWIEESTLKGLFFCLVSALLWSWRPPSRWGLKKNCIILFCSWNASACSAVQCMQWIVQGSVQNVARRLGKCRSDRRMQIPCMVLIIEDVVLHVFLLLGFALVQCVQSVHWLGQRCSVCPLTSYNPITTFWAAAGAWKPSPWLYYNPHRSVEVWVPPPLAIILCRKVVTKLSWWQQMGWHVTAALIM